MANPNTIAPKIASGKTTKSFDFKLMTELYVFDYKIQSQHHQTPRIQKSGIGDSRDLTIDIIATNFVLFSRGVQYHTKLSSLVIEHQSLERLLP